MTAHSSKGLTHLLFRIDQIGVDTLIPSTDNEHTSTIFQEKEAVTAIQITSQGSSFKPSKLIQILKAIRFLTTNSVASKTTSTILSDDFGAACSIVQLQLEQILSIPGPPNLEVSCALVAVIYINLILLDTLVVEVIKSNFTRQLHEMMIPVRSAGELKENGDIITWISAMASAAFGDRESQKPCILKKFQVALAVLEARAAAEQ